MVMTYKMGDGYKRVLDYDSLEINKKDIKLSHVIHRREKDIRLDFFYTVSKYEGEIKNMEENKCDELKWVKLDKLPKNILPYIKQGIYKTVKQVLYSDIGF